MMMRPYFFHPFPIPPVCPGVCKNLRLKKTRLMARIESEIREAAATGRTAFHPLMEQLRTALRELFEAEETLMIRHRYPDYETQCAAHRHLYSRLAPETNAEVPAVWLLKHLRVWLMQHEWASDRHFLKYLSDLEIQGKIQPPSVDPLRDFHPDFPLLPIKALDF